MKYFSQIAVVTSVILLILLGRNAVTSKGQTYEIISSGWTLEIGDVKNPNFSLSSLDKLSNLTKSSRAVVSRAITVPDSCFKTPCYIFLGEVGDVSKVYLDNNLIKAQGFNANGRTLARHIPLIAEIPLNSKSLQTLKVETESLFGVNFGFQRGPYFIGDYAAARYYERVLLLQSVAFPLMQALVLTLLGLLVFISWPLVKNNQSVVKFGTFCFAEALFMVSFSFIPREYLDPPLSGFVHYSSRILADWALFEFLNSVVLMPKSVRLIFRIAFPSYLIWLLVTFLNGGEFTSFVKITKDAAPFIIGSPLLALVIAVKLIFRNKELPVIQFHDLPILIPTIAGLLFCQIWDTSIFWGLFTGAYLIKVYLAPLALMFAIVLVRRFFRSLEVLQKAKANSERDSFLGQIAIEFSHDLKSPLNALKTSAEIALSQNDQEYSRRVLADVARRTTDVTDRLQGLLEYSRNQINERNWANLKEIEKQILEEASPAAIEKNIVVNISMPKGMFSLDVVSIKRAIVNLVQNAIEASAPGSTVRVVGYLELDKLMIEVKDSGVGIDQKDIKRIFDPYFTKGKTKGTGLGLSIVDRILRQHGGSIQVKSQPNLGSTFVMEIPR